MEENRNQQLTSETEARTATYVKWQKYLKVDSNDLFVLSDLAVTLDNQRRSTLDNQRSNFRTEETKYLLPIVRQVYRPNSMIRNLCDCYATVTPVATTFWRDGDRIRAGKLVHARTGKLQTGWRPESFTDSRSSSNISMEQEYMAVVAESIELELVSFIAESMRKAAAYSASCHLQHLPDTILSMASAIHRQTGKKPNRLHVPRDIANILVPGCNSFLRYDKGTIEIDDYQFNVTTDWLTKKHECLVGYKGDGAFNGPATYFTRVPLIVTPTVLDPDSFCPQAALLHQSALAFRPGSGRYHFARIKVRGVPS